MRCYSLEAGVGTAGEGVQEADPHAVAVAAGPASPMLHPGYDAHLQRLPPSPGGCRPVRYVGWSAAGHGQPAAARRPPCRARGCRLRRRHRPPGGEQANFQGLRPHGSADRAKRSTNSYKAAPGARPASGFLAGQPTISQPTISQRPQRHLGAEHTGQQRRGRWSTCSSAVRRRPRCAADCACGTSSHSCREALAQAEEWWHKPYHGISQLILIVPQRAPGSLGPSQGLGFAASCEFLKPSPSGCAISLP